MIAKVEFSFENVRERTLCLFVVRQSISSRCAARSRASRLSGVTPGDHEGLIFRRVSRAAPCAELLTPDTTR